MCNLYSVTKGQSAIRDLFRATNDRVGNLPLSPAIFPRLDRPRRAHGERELVMARWGMAGPPQFGGAPIIDVRFTEPVAWSCRWPYTVGESARCILGHDFISASLRPPDYRAWR